VQGTGLGPTSGILLAWETEVNDKLAQYMDTWGSHVTIRNVHATYAAALKTTTHPNLGAENHMLQLNI